MVLMCFVQLSIVFGRDFLPILKPYTSIVFDCYQESRQNFKYCDCTTFTDELGESVFPDPTYGVTFNQTKSV